MPALPAGFVLDVSVLEGWQQALEDWLRFGTQLMSRTAETVAAFIIAVGVLTALFTYLISWVRRVASGTTNMTQTEGIRLQLGAALALGLEFLLAADILATAVAPSWDAIGKLAAIATIRTLLNYFLERELRQEEERQALSTSSRPLTMLNKLAYRQDPHRRSIARRSRNKR